MLYFRSPIDEFVDNFKFRLTQTLNNRHHRNHCFPPGELRFCVFNVIFCLICCRSLSS
ncbi:hypothetical protein Hanom_Chr01g00021691 [Helianthus anomalus]